MTKLAMIVLLCLLCRSLLASGLSVQGGKLSVRGGKLIVAAATTQPLKFSGFTYQRTLTIDHTKVGTNTLTLADFPVLISTTNVTFSTVSAGGHLSSALGFDLVFSTKSDCSYRLRWDTETVNNSGAAPLNVWVKVPAISSSTDTTFYMCYGSSTLSSYQGISTGTWDSDYKGVWHLPSGSDQFAIDSTANKWDGVISSGTTLSVPGKIAGGIRFPGNSKVAISSAVLGSNSIKTLSTWINPDNEVGDWLGSNFGDIHFNLGNFSPMLHSLTVWTTGSGYGNLSAVDTLPNGATHYITVAMAISSDTASGYIDGLLTGTTSYSRRGLSNTSKIGSAYNGTSAFFTGWMDEFRISVVVRSPDWVLTEYNNQNSPSTFLSISAETVGP